MGKSLQNWKSPIEPEAERIVSNCHSKFDLRSQAGKLQKLCLSGRFMSGKLWWLGDLGKSYFSTGSKIGNPLVSFEGKQKKGRQRQCRKPFVVRTSRSNRIVFTGSPAIWTWSIVFLELRTWYATLRTQENNTPTYLTTVKRNQTFEIFRNILIQTGQSGPLPIPISNRLFAPVWIIWNYWSIPIQK